MQETQPKFGTLYVVPNTLGKTPENNTIPDYVLNIIRNLDLFITENIKSATKYLQWTEHNLPDYEIEFFVLNKETPKSDIATFLDPLESGRDAGILSEAGCPVIADPGSGLIEMAHSRGIKVKPLVGPSSVLLALIGSGFNGQSFSFHGYLPRDEDARITKLKRLEAESRDKNMTQLFIETPYRNEEFVQCAVLACRPETKFCSAVNLSLPDETIISKSISEWKRQPNPPLRKKPAIFLLYAGS